MLEAIERIRDAMLANASDDHEREVIDRAYVYAASRIEAGHATTEGEARISMASFADGFCTGFHRGNGTVCTR